MSSTHSKRRSRPSMDMVAYMRETASDNTIQQNRLKRNLSRALCEDVTPRQRDMLLLYYSKRMTMQEIAHRLGVDKSTVSRTIKRGETRLERCLRYGAENLLAKEEDD